MRVRLALALDVRVDLTVLARTLCNHNNKSCAGRQHDTATDRFACRPRFPATCAQISPVEPAFNKVHPFPFLLEIWYHPHIPQCVTSYSRLLLLRVAFVRPSYILCVKAYVERCGNREKEQPSVLVA